MVKIRVLVVCSLMAVFLALTFGAGEASALRLFDDTLVITGWLRNDTAIRLEDREWVDPSVSPAVVNASLDQGDLARCRTTLHVETDWQLTDSVRFATIAEGFYEAKYSLNRDLLDTNEYYTDYIGNKDLWNAEPRGTNMQKDFEFKEWHFTYQSGPFIAKVGRQQVVWGESDNLRMADIINPLDLSWNTGFPAWEEIRIPLRMVRIFYVAPDSPNRYQVEVVINPEDYRPNSFGPYGDQAWPKGDRPVLFGDAGFRSEKDMLPDRHNLRNFQGGVRARGVYGGWDIYLYHYYYRVPGAVTTMEGSLPGLFPFDLTDGYFGHRAHYPFVNTFGATVNVFEPRTGVVFRGECGFTPDMPYSTWVDYSVTGPYFDTEFIERDQFAFMVGFDRPTFITLLNPTRTFLISGQLFQTFVLDIDDDDYARVFTLLGDDGGSDRQTTLTFMMNTEYWDAKLKPQVVVVWEPDAKDGFVNPQLAYEPNYNWRIELGARFIWGDTYDSGTFGGVKNNDEAWIKVDFKF